MHPNKGFSQVISVEEVAALVRDTLADRVSELQDIEVRAFTSGLLTSFGLAAVNKALDARWEGESEDVLVFESIGGFDFKELGRDDLVRSLDAATGLGLENCAQALASLEALVGAKLAAGSTVTIERLGRAQPTYGAGFLLELSEDLRIRRPSGQHDQVLA